VSRLATICKRVLANWKSVKFGQVKAPKAHEL